MRILGVSLLIVCVAAIGCTRPLKNNLPPAQMMMEPGPGVGGPGPGVMIPPSAPPMRPMASQVAFVSPEGMMVTWDVAMPGQFDSEPLVTPGRYNFPQGAIYRLKLTNIPGRLGVELYPTLEVGPAMPRTEAFLSHNAIPIQFSIEDFDQVLSGNFVTKVIYLPDPEFQELALAGVETLVSTRLDPGVDPVIEADRRGSILAIVRLGNKDLEVPTEMMESGAVEPVSYNADAGPGAMPMGRPMGMPVGGPTTMPSPNHYISGVNGPQYGMPTCGTPIGLPGPPHIPLGVPAGLQRHTVRNHTKVCMPQPTKHFKMDVKQRPGFTYPKPVDHLYVSESTFPGVGLNCQPRSDKRQLITPDPCATGGGVIGGWDSGTYATDAGSATVEN